MKKMLVVVLAVAGLVLAVSLAHGEDCTPRCGKQGGGLECPNNKCCSVDGYCGLGDDYCDEGCQSGVCYPSNRRCGPKYGNANCTNNYCCSAKGYCGLGAEYCGAGCQTGFCYVQANQRCYKPKGVRYDVGSRYIPCDSNMCCGYGYDIHKGGHYWQCGIGSEFCGDNCRNGPCYPRSGGAMAADANASASAGVRPRCENLCGKDGGGLECPQNQCCSKHGECGLGKDYCGVGCQSGECYSGKQRCGRRFGNAKCTNNYCCNGDGFCGFGDHYCSAASECQSAYGLCYKAGCRGSDQCPNNMCCGDSGLCGIGDFYCGDACTKGPCYYPPGTVAAPANATALLLTASSTLQQS